MRAQRGADRDCLTAETWSAPSERAHSACPRSRLSPAAHSSPHASSPLAPRTTLLVFQPDDGGSRIGVSRRAATVAQDRRSSRPTPAAGPAFRPLPGCRGSLPVRLSGRNENQYLLIAVSHRSGSIALAVTSPKPCCPQESPGRGGPPAGAAAFALRFDGSHPWLRVASGRALASCRRPSRQAFVLLAAFSQASLFWWEPTTTLRGFAGRKMRAERSCSRSRGSRANTGRDR